MTPRQIYPKRDANQKDITDALLKIGCQVFDTSAVGDGFPDLAVLYGGHIILLEVKTPGNRNRLTDDEQAWWRTFHGPGFVVDSPDMAVEEVQIYLKEHEDD